MNPHEIAVPDDERGAAVLRETVRRLVEIGKAKAHPAHLLQHVECIDRKTGERFEFQLANPDDPWYWQRDLLDWWITHQMTIVLKGRQLGVTWVAAGLALWTLLYQPGSSVLCYSINEDEAATLVGRIWDMYLSLPEHLKAGTEVIKPTRGARPHTVIELKHPDGRISTLTGMASTESAGRGRTSALVILDEYAFQKYAAGTWKSVYAGVADGGRVIVISTANGVSNELTGEGNFYHHLYANAGEGDYKELYKRFLRWSLHPDRDEDWYARLIMKPDQKASEYPNDEDEAFLLSGRPFFDRESLAYYTKHRKRAPLYRAEFKEVAVGRAGLERREDGPILVFEEPWRGGEREVINETTGELELAEEPAHDYAIAADVATGRGLDYSSAVVIDLATMAPVAEFHDKLGADEYAEQLHYLGRYYNTALIAPEMGGGYGEPVVLALKDGRKGRPPYPRLYRHRQHDRPDKPEAKPYGFPMNLKTRPQVINQLEQAIRERTLPYVSSGTLSELQTFVHRKTNPSPAAEDGCNDDRVMALAIGLELYRQFGHHPLLRKRRNRRRKRRQYKPQFAGSRR